MIVSDEIRNPPLKEMIKELRTNKEEINNSIRLLLQAIKDSGCSSQATSTRAVLLCVLGAKLGYEMAIRNVDISNE
jgi:hypothetical protein